MRGEPHSADLCAWRGRRPDLQRLCDHAVGLYDAFKTAANAKRAIVEGRSFSETNKEEFRKMEHQKKVYEFFFSPIGWRLLRWALRCPRIIKWLFDAKMKRETFRA